MSHAGDFHLQAALVGVPARDADLDEIGVDVHRHHAKTFDDIDPSSFDLIVTLSPEAHHSALEFTRNTATEVEYWPVPDPSAVEGSREARLDAYRRTRDMILARLKQLGATPVGSATQHARTMELMPASKRRRTRPDKDGVQLMAKARLWLPSSLSPPRWPPSSVPPTLSPPQIGRAHV